MKRNNILLLNSGVKPASLDINLLSTTSLDPHVGFSRTSHALQYNSNGALTFAPSNMLIHSGDFTNTWGTIAGTVTAVTGQADPDGGTTAVKLTSTTAGDQWGITPGGALVVGYQYVWSAWIRADAPTTVATGFYDGTTLTAHSFSVTTSWTRYQFAFTATNTILRFQLFAVPVNGTVAYFAKAQLEPSLSGVAQPYVATNTTAYLGPRFDYDPSTVNPSVPHNLLTQSSPGSWVGPGAGFTLTSNYAAASDGTTTATRIVWTSTSNSYAYGNNNNVSPGQVYWTYIELKANLSAPKVPVVVGTIDGATQAIYTFDLNAISGTLTSSGSVSSMNAGFVPLSNGWYGIYVGATFGVTVNNLSAGISAQSTTAGDILVARASLNLQSRTSFVPTSGSAIAPTYVSKGLLSEITTTNLALQSNAFGTTPWISVTTSQTQNASGPDGGATSAWTVTQTGANSTDSRLQQNVTVAADNSVYTGSIYIAKSVTTSWFPALRMEITGGTTVNNVLVLNAQTGAFVSSGGTAAVQSVGNFWRVSLSVTNNSSAGNTSLSLMFYPGWSGTLSTTESTITGATAIIYGTQIEQLGIMTNYVPTTTITVARSSDFPSLAQASFPFNVNNSTFVVQFIVGGAIAGGRNLLGVNSSIQIIQPINGQALTTGYSAGDGTTVVTTPYLLPINTVTKVGVSWSPTIPASLVGNANTVIHGSAPFVVSGFSTSPLGLGCSTNGSNPVGQVWIQRIRYWNSTLTDINLQALTR
jgi:hypothetical protein